MAAETRDESVTPMPVPADAPGVLLFGGTFDPPHRGHTEPAAAARDAMMPPGSWLVFVPAARSPHKSAAPATSRAAHRGHAPAGDRLGWRGRLCGRMRSIGPRARWRRAELVGGDAATCEAGAAPGHGTAVPHRVGSGGGVPPLARVP
ncbi:MAG: hypothetical protein KIS87_07100 [Phycisphaeraceae bacterium]|nr:hypothetical protein [Phycisphaeraceae bacterium]